MAHYAIINLGLYNNLVSKKMQEKKNYNSAITIGNATIRNVGQLTNNKYVIRCCFADEKYLDNKCAQHEPDSEELQDWIKEIGQINIVTSLEGLTFKYQHD